MFTREELEQVLKTCKPSTSWSTDWGNNTEGLCPSATIASLRGVSFKHNLSNLLPKHKLYPQTEFAQALARAILQDLAVFTGFTFASEFTEAFKTNPNHVHEFITRHLETT